MSSKDEQLDMLAAEKRWLTNEYNKLKADIIAKKVDVKDPKIRQLGREIIGRFRQISRDIQKFMES